jgi:hypothetical protein
MRELALTNIGVGPGSSGHAELKPILNRLQWVKVFPSHILTTAESILKPITYTGFIKN